MARKYADDADDDYEFDEDLDTTEAPVEEAPIEEYEQPTDAVDSDDGIVFEEVDLTEDASDEPEVEVEERHKQKKSYLPVFIVLGTLLVLVACVICVLLFMKESPNTTMVDMAEYLEVGDGEIAFYMNGARVESPLILEGDALYITHDFVNQNLTSKFYYDKSLDCVLYTTAYAESMIGLDEKTFLLDGETVSYEDPMVIRKGDVVYLSLKFVFETDAYGFGYYVDENPMRVHMFSGDLKQKCIVWAENSVIDIRVANSTRASLVASFGSDDDSSDWYVTGEDYGNSGWTLVQAMDGRYGYVKNELIVEAEGHTFEKTVREATAYPCIQKEYDVLLGWQGVYSITDNDKVENLVSNASTMNTISPTWYKVSDNDGNVNSFASQSYVDYVHGKGLEIWPLISDFNFYHDDNISEAAFLRDYEARQHLISILMSEAQAFGYDGWNIDFEHVPSESGYDFIQLIRELSIACREAGLVLSVDNNVPRSWSTQYMRAEQGECIDYYIIMGYDEHWSGCDEAGSTASIGFVTEGLDATLAMVPADKVLMGVPFYTRLWMFATDENGNSSLTSKTQSMRESLEVVDSLGLTKEWDSSVGQYVAKGIVDDVYYSIWLEESDSTRTRVKAIRERNVAGLAAWALGFEMPEAWEILEK